MSQTLQTVAVIGAGTMGAGIAEVAAAAGHPVLLYDIAAEALTRAVEGIRQRLAARVARGKLTADQADALVARLVPVTELAALSDAWLVIEAASERPDVKKALFNQLAAICSPSTLLTSNTSSISITAIAADVRHPERVAGLHFFNPAPVMKLVEVVSGLATSPEVVEQLCRRVTAWGKQPVRCRSTPGFIVNRVARPFYAEAWRALEEQVAPPAVIDAALRDGGGFPMGPLALTDLIGQDVNFAVTCSVFNAFWQDRRFLPSLVQQELALAGRLGKKSGQGVYRWPIESASVPALAAVAETRGAKTVCTTGDSVTGRVAIALDDVRLLETEGETAQALSVRYGCPVVVYDYCAGDTVVLATAATNPASATDKAVRYFQQQGKKVLLIADYPGLLVWRTLAMLINEALDAVQKGSPARKISIPRCAWASTIRMARWRGANLWAGSACCACWRTCNSTMAKSVIAPVPYCARRRLWRSVMSNEAWRNARAMYEKDTCARTLGIEIIEMDDGYAQMSMTVSSAMLNGHQTCHGGQLFSLADTAFAYACNSQGLAAVASAASIDFLRPAFAGDRLVATARVKQQGKLTGVYDIEIVNQQQKIVALFRGKSHRIGGTITGEV